MLRNCETTLFLVDLGTFLCLFVWHVSDYDMAYRIMIAYDSLGQDCRTQHS